MGARKWVIGGFLAAVLLVVGLGVYAARAKENREQNEAESALATAVARAESLGLPIYADHLRTDPIPDEENAWIELKEFDSVLRSSDHLGAAFSELYREIDRSTFNALFEEHELQIDNAFQLANIAAGKPRYVPERQWEEGTFMLLSDLASDKRLIQALMVKSRYALYNGDATEAKSSLRIASSIAVHLSSERSAIGSMAQSAIQAVIAREIVGQAGTSRSSEYRVFLRSTLDSLYQERDVKQSYIEEVILFVETIRMVSDQNEYGNELRSEISEDDLSLLGNATGLSLSAKDARKFEVRAINAACDFYDGLSPNIADFVRNDEAFVRLLTIPPKWAADGFPFGLIEMVYVMSGDDRPYARLAQDALRAEMYRLAFTVVTGSIALENGETKSAQSLPGAELEYLNHEGGFSITATAPDLEPITVKVDRPE